MPVSLQCSGLFRIHRRRSICESGRQEWACLPLQVEFEEEYSSRFREKIKVDCVFEFCRNAQKRSSATSSKNMPAHLIVNLCLKSGKTSGRLSVVSFLFDQLVFAVVDQTNKRLVQISY